MINWTGTSVEFIDESLEMVWIIGKFSSSALITKIPTFLKYRLDIIRTIAPDYVAATMCLSIWVINHDVVGGIFIFVRMLLLATTDSDSSGYEIILFFGGTNGSFQSPEKFFPNGAQTFRTFWCFRTKNPRQFFGYHTMNLKMIEDFEIVSP